MIARRLSLLLVLALTHAMTLPSLFGQTAAWPEFRGTSAQGHLDSDVPVPDDFSPEQNVAWKVSIDGKGWSSPVLYGNSVLVTTAVETGDDRLSLRVLDIDFETGEVVREVEVFETDQPRIHGKNSHASPTPIVTRDRVYVHFGHQSIACLDRDLELVWKYDTIEYNAVHGSGGSPILVDNQLIFSVDGGRQTFVQSLDAESGEELWRAERDSDAGRKFSFCTPLLIDVEMQPQLICPGSDCVIALDPSDGSEIWRVNYTGYSVIPRPIYANGLVYVCTGYDRPTLLAIRPTGDGDVTETHVEWSTNRNVPHTPSLLAIEGSIIMISDAGIASSLDGLDGSVNWTERVSGNYSASPIYADGKVFVMSEQGECTIIRGHESFEPIAEIDMEERILASLAVHPNDGSLLLRTESHLYRIH